MAAEQVETTKVYARGVAKIEPEWVEKCGAHLIKRQYYDPHWEKKAARAAVFERIALFGLNILAGRRVPYENVDPKAAREIFIRSALVEMQYDSKAPFFIHNRELLAEADYLQQKGRRVDLVADEDWIYQFYDGRIPPDVVNGITFENWRKKAEKGNPGLLKMTREDITRKEDEALHDQNFPDELAIGDIRLPLEYRFEPGHEDDGVTAIIPIHLLNQLPPRAFHVAGAGLVAGEAGRLDQEPAEGDPAAFRAGPGFRRSRLAATGFRTGQTDPTTQRGPQATGRFQRRGK